MGDLVSLAAPVAGAYFGGPVGAQIGGMIGGALAGGQQVNEANQRYQQAQQASQFRPVGVTTTFGTTKYGYDDQGRLTDAGYTLAPQLQAYQDQLAGMTGQGLQASQGLLGLGQQYLAESPEAARQRYVQQQTSLLAPGQEQKLAEIRNNLFQTGRSGLATGATNAGGLAATNPEMAAYYNALAQQQAQIAAGAEQAAQNQIKFGTGLLTSAYAPFKAGLQAQQGVETMGQGALDLGLSVGKSVTQGAQTGADYLTKQQNPYLTAASGLLSNQQLIGGIGGMFGDSTGATDVSGLGMGGYSSGANYGFGTGSDYSLPSAGSSYGLQSTGRLGLKGY